MWSLRSFVNGALCIGLTAAATLSAATSFAQKKDGLHLAYVYPAGGRQGETFQVTLGGKDMNFASDAYVSGEGVHAKVVDYVKPLNKQQVNRLRERIQELEKKKSNDPDTAKQVAELRRQIITFRKDLNPAFAELVTLEIHVDADAEPGDRDLRLATAAGLSNPMVFHIGQLAEFSKKNVDRSEEGAKGKGDAKSGDPKNKGKRNDPRPPTDITLPAMVNGQIMPGEVDRYTFHAAKNQRLVVAVQARALIPYLADAVPGWFQAVAAVYDAAGKELAYDDHYRFRPDPVLYCKIPKDGQYVLEIRDSLYRGREDFVYRVAIGEIPYITSVFPLGGPAGKQTTVELKGWNLPERAAKVDPDDQGPRILPLSVRKGKLVSNRVRFAVDTLPECLEEEPNNGIADAQAVTLPIIINGRVDPPGDCDVFRFEGRAGQTIVADVDAREFDSPLDSILKLTSADDRVLDQNDDAADKEAGLCTHQADSRITFALPADGVYYVWLGDAQRKGGPDHAYRLRLSAPRPDFALQVEPSSIGVRPGESASVKVHVIRKDGFVGEIAIDLGDASQGFTLGKVNLPAEKDEVQFKIAAPREAHDDLIGLSVAGHATMDGQKVTRLAVPSDDMMQAFIYHHLVPAKEFVATIIDRGPPKIQWKLLGDTPLKIPAGGKASVRFSASQTAALPQLRLILRDPLAGLSMEDVTPNTDGVAFVLRADAAELKPGYKGNLTIDVVLERQGKAKNGKAKEKNRRIPLGSLPNIAYEITK